MKFRTFFLFLAFSLPAVAQTPAPGGFTYSADKTSYRANGIRLDGNARVQSPELDVAANAIAFDLEAGAGLKEIRAIGNVSLKLNIKPKSGGDAARVEATCGLATLTPGDKKLVLKTKLNGFYQIGNGPKNTLSGDSATLTFAPNAVTVAVEGGKEGVTVVLPAEQSGKMGALGKVTLKANNATFDEKSGVGRFTGNARAFSDDGPNKFDVAAPEFVLTRASDGTISTLTTTGRTIAKLDLPPDPTPEKTSAATVNGANLSKPTHVEIEGDAATIERATQTIVFDGNVKGFYRLVPAGQGPQNYDFSGNKATFKFAETPSGTLAAGLNVEIIGAPVSIKAPPLNLGF